MPKKILILGSKPNSLVPKAEILYCANATAAYYKDSIKNIVPQKVFTVVSSTELVSSNRTSIEKQEWIANRVEKILNCKSDKFFVTWSDVYPESINKLLSKNHSSKIEPLSAIEVEFIVNQILGIRYPVFCFNHLQFGAFNSLRHVLRFVIEKYKKITNKQYNCSALFRPSTGIIALLIAIKNHGKDCEYIVSGIGVDARGDYPDASRNTWTNKNSLLYNHILVDKFFAKKLFQKYNITFIDKSFKYLNL